ncbi:MAG: hypothetical protein CVT81_06540 [Alphaproteobacteria bacterium HGW-Alphaproteobacteria-3]|jgi:uncharacterized protein YggU (UPF0235/DUF167 family)|nr:MAG: hypothetical protein CVT81_06540 [Alphaproteobacteria bacterium HGW-Alphaproteobacteria-3]
MLVKPTAGGVTVRLRVTPRGGSDRIEGRGEDADGVPHLRLRVSDVAEKGKANAAVLKLLAKAWGVPRSSLSIASGETGRNKIVAVAGDPGDLRGRIETWLESLVERPK